jgi:hypothetical protein
MRAAERYLTGKLRERVSETRIWTLLNAGGGYIGKYRVSEKAPPREEAAEPETQSGTDAGLGRKPLLRKAHWTWGIPPVRR